MTVEINEDDYILGVWFGESKDRSNYLITVKRGKTKSSWDVNLCIQVRKDKKIWRSKDDKSFFKTTMNDLTESEVEGKVNNELIPMFDELFNHRKCYTEIKGDSEKFAFKIAQQDWAHVKIYNKRQERKGKEYK